jgi:transcriptional regulator with XRE-family HTH domain
MHKKGGTELGTLYERITALCKSKGVSGSRMCLDLGLSKSTMSDMKHGRTKGISIPTAQKIAGYFGITVDELYGVEEEIQADPVGMAERHFEMVMDEDLSEIFEDFKSLDATKRKIVKDLVRSLAETKKSEV